MSISGPADKQCWPGQAFGISIYWRGGDPRAAHCCSAGFWNIPHTQVIIIQKYYLKKLYKMYWILHIDLQFVWSIPRSVRLSFQWLNPYYQLTEPDNSSITCTGPPDAALRQKCQSRTILTPGQRGVIRGWRAPRKTTTHVIWPMTVAIVCENIWLKIMLYAQNVIGFCPCSVSFLKLYPDRVMNIVQENMSSSFSVA